METQSAAEQRSWEAIGHIEQAMRSLQQLQEQKAAAEHRADRAEARAIAEKQRAAELEERLQKAEANAKGNAPMSYVCLRARMHACLCV